MNENEIISLTEKLIEKGLIRGYTQNISFTQNYSDLQSRVIEYLIVVNIAQSLTDLIGYGIQINLEHSLNDFYENAFPRTIFSGGIFGMNITKRKNHSPEDSKSKRLDIVLTSENKSAGEFFSSAKSLFGIEVKSINQKDKKIKEDIDRLAKAMMLNDDISKNNIIGCFSCFFRRFDKDSTTIFKAEIEKKSLIEQNKWETYFVEIGKTYSNLTFELIPVIVVNKPMDEFKYFEPEIDYDYSEVLENTGYVSAYMVKITRKR